MSTTPARCTHTAPDALTGGLRPSPRCKHLVGPDGAHTGDHRSRYTVPNVGKAVITWKGAREPQRRPEIALPVPSADHINPANGRLA